MFAYFFYRLYHHYENFKGYNDYGFHASCFLSAIQITLLFFILSMIRMVFHLSIPMEWHNYTKIICIVLVISMAFLNYKCFNKRILDLDYKYANSVVNKWFKDWMFFGIILILVITPFIISHFNFRQDIKFDSSGFAILGISLTYFVIDLTTDGFNGWGKMP